MKLVSTARLGYSRIICFFVEILKTCGLTVCYSLQVLWY